MGLWMVDADTLAGARFVISPLAETTSALMTLAAGAAGHPGETRRLARDLPRYRAYLAADPINALLVEAVLGWRWVADFVTPTPSGEGADFGTEVAAVRDHPAAAAVADLALSVAGPVPAALHRDDLPQRAAAVLSWVWEETVRPDWARRRRVLEADIVARTHLLSVGGWAALLDEIRPGTRWLGDGRLQVNKAEYPPRDLTGARVLFVPVTGRNRWVSYDESARRHALVYPCTGVAAAETPVAPAGLARLLGAARANVLLLLDTPKTTTQLAALTAQPLGSVGRHLRVLLDAHLVERRRSGRSVLYYRTSAAATLLAAQTRA